MSDKFDVTIIGSGPGGYVAAIRCAQLGFKTAIIERYNSLGGTCLNVGCIPSKALLDSTEHFAQAKHQFKEHGIEIEGLSLDFKQMIKRKGEVVKQTTGGIDFLMKKNKITVFTGHASFKDKNTIAIRKDGNKTEEIKTEKVIIATGSKPASLPNIEIDKKRIITSTEALELAEVPKKLLVIGGGYIGCEMAAVYNRIGSEVTIVEFMDKIIPNMDSDLSKELTRVFRKSKIDIKTNHNVTGVSVEGNKVTLTATDKKDKEVVFEGDYCLVAVGRKPYTADLGLDKAGLKTNEKGFIPVNGHLETEVEGIFAIGDVIGGLMLAHKAEDEGSYVAEYMAGEKPHIDYNLIPGVVYTWPEVASVGKSEDQLKEEGREIKTGKFPFKASGRARASMDTDGFIKIIADAKTDEVLGVHLIGPRMADLIMEAVVAMEFRASAEDIVRMSHPHPTYSEAMREAAMGATGDRAIHI
ncbi:MAG: dihydrolipoyl dehydrogenase [Bacteroidia bacterium]